MSTFYAPAQRAPIYTTNASQLDVRMLAAQVLNSIRQKQMLHEALFVFQQSLVYSFLTHILCVATIL